MCCIVSLHLNRNQMSTLSEEQKVNAGAAKIVLSFLSALNNEDFDGAADYVNEDLQFTGILSSRKGAQSYLNNMRQLKIKYKVHKPFSDAVGRVYYL